MPSSIQVQDNSKHTNTWTIKCQILEKVIFSYWIKQQGSIAHKSNDTGVFDFIQALIKNTYKSSQVLIFP